MSRKKIKISIESYGRYSHWDRSSRELPKVLEFTTRIEAKAGNEFGMVLNILRAKGTTLNYCIKHPPFSGPNGFPEPDFTGEYVVNNNIERFFIGDCVWVPVEDKTGDWHISVEHEGKIIAEKKFEIFLPDKI